MITLRLSDRQRELTGSTALLEAQGRWESGMPDEYDDDVSEQSDPGDTSTTEARPSRFSAITLPKWPAS